MASRIAAQFAAAERPLLIPYVTAGWPAPQLTAPLLHACEKGGADVLEIGVPFSDPSADGKVIQLANQQALAAGANLDSALAAARQYRDQDGRLPIVLMGYANPFYRRGFARLAADCAAAGVDGILAVDWPPAAGDALGAALAGRGVDRVVLLATTTPLARVGELSALGSGYAYYVALQGVTGSARLDSDAAAAAAHAVREHSALPVAVGFGVRSAGDCAKLGAHFDAVIVGSKLIEEIRDAPGAEAGAAARLLAQMREALA